MTEFEERWRPPTPTRQSLSDFQQWSPGAGESTLFRDGKIEQAVMRTLIESLATNGGRIEELLVYSKTGRRDHTTVTSLADALSPRPIIAYSRADTAHRNRRIIFSAFRAEALVRTYPHFGNSRHGWGSYMVEDETFGTKLLVESCFLNGSEERVLGSLRYCTKDNEDHLGYIFEALEDFAESKNMDYLRVVSWEFGKQGCMVTHWFSESGIRKFVENYLGESVRKRTSIMSGAQGFVVSVDPSAPPTSILLVPNFEVSRLPPEDWTSTFATLRQLSGS